MDLLQYQDVLKNTKTRLEKIDEKLEENRYNLRFYQRKIKEYEEKLALKKDVIQCLKELKKGYISKKEFQKEAKNIIAKMCSIYNISFKKEEMKVINEENIASLKLACNIIMKEINYLTSLKTATFDAYEKIALPDTAKVIDANKVGVLDKTIFIRQEENKLYAYDEFERKVAIIPKNSDIYTGKINTVTFSNEATIIIDSFKEEKIKSDVEYFRDDNNKCITFITNKIVVIKSGKNSRLIAFDEEEQKEICEVPSGYSISVEGIYTNKLV